MTNGLLDQCPGPNDTPACPRVSHLMTSLGRNTATSQIAQSQNRNSSKKIIGWSWHKILFSEWGVVLGTNCNNFILMALVGDMNEVKRENLVNILVTCLCRLTGYKNMDLWLLQVRMITIGLSKKNIFTIQIMAAEARKTINCRSYSKEKLFHLA